MKVYYGLSSGFGEYRPTHFHAGVDLSTKGKSGYRIYAVSDGEIFRLKHTKRGYGKAVYLKHENGYISIYAHLSFFNNELGLEDIVRKKAGKRVRYAGDIYLENPIKVKKGDKLGLTGETGSGLPHLHFEVRDSDNNPVNPYLAGFFFEDKQKPVLEKIILEPLDHLSAVNGGRDISTIPITEAESARPILRGKIRCRIQASDRGGSRGLLGLYSIDVTLDDKPLIKEKFDNFSYDTSYLVGVIIDPVRSHLSPTVYTYNLFRQKGSNSNVFDFVSPLAENFLDVDALAPGPHNITITASDAAGNNTEAVFHFIVNHPPSVEFNRKSPLRTDGKINIDLHISGGDPGSTIHHIEAEYSEDRGLSWHSDNLQTDLYSYPSPSALPMWRISRDKPFEPGSIVQIRARAFDGHEFSSWARSPIIIVLPVKTVDKGRSGATSTGWMRVTSRQDKTFPVRPQPSNAGGAEMNVVNHGSFTSFKIKALPPRWSNPSIKLTGPDGHIATIKSVWLRDNNYEVLLPFQNRSQGTWQAEVAGEKSFAGSEKTIDILPIKPSEGGKVLWENLELIFPPDSLYEKAFISKEPSKALIGSELKQVSSAYHLKTTSYPFDKQVKIKLKAHMPYEDFQRVGMYSFDNFLGRWFFLDALSDRQKDWVAAYVRHFSDYVLLEDTVEPAISRVTPADGSVSGKPESVVFKLSDRGMGIDDSRIKVLIDNRPVYAEYDPDRGKVTAPINIPLKKGKHDLHIEAFDRAGNAAKSFRGKFTVR